MASLKSAPLRPWVSLPLTNVLIMLTRITLAKRSVSNHLSTGPSSRHGVSSLNPSSLTAPVAHGRTRLLCSQSKGTAESAYNSTGGEFLSQVITQLDNNITEQYWPGSTPKESPPTSNADSQAEASPRQPEYHHSRDSRPHRDTHERSNGHRDSSFPRQHRDNHSREHSSHRSERRHNNFRDQSNEGFQSEKRRDKSRTWQVVRNENGSTPSAHPRTNVASNPKPRDPRLLVSKPHTSHLTEKSIYLRQSIVSAPSREVFLQECETFLAAPNFDPFVLEVSRLVYLERNDSPELNARPHVEAIIKILVDGLTKVMEESKDNSGTPMSYTGERIDLAISVIPAKDFPCIAPLLQTIVKFLGEGGLMDPMVLPSTWRRIWTHTAHAVTQAGFSATKFATVCELCVAIWNHIYLHQAEMVGHLRFGGEAPRSIINFLPRDPRYPDRPIILDIELNKVTLNSDEAPLLRGPQAISAMLGILSQVGGHQALKRACIDLYHDMSAVPNAFPSRRIFPLSALLLSWKEHDAAMTGLNHLAAEHASQIDPKSSQHELDALQYLMVSNCPSELLMYAEATLKLNGHVPSPLALTQVMWAATETKEWDRIKSWWAQAVKVWRNLPAVSQKGQAMPRLVRPTITSSVDLLNIAAEFYTLEDLQQLTQDFIDVFGIQPLGSRSRIVVKHAQLGHIRKAIEMLGDTQTKKKIVRKETDSEDSPTMHLMTSRVLLASCIHRCFESNIYDLITASTVSTIGAIRVGSLIDYTTSTLPTIDTREEAASFEPYLNWIAGLPLLEYDASTGQAVECSPDPIFGTTPLSARMATLLAASRAENADIDPCTLGDQVQITARTAARLTELAGLRGNPDLVKNFIKRINVQHQVLNDGQAVPFSLVWLRPLIRAHALSGHTDTVFQLLASLKDNVVPSDRADAWKLAYKSYSQIRDAEAALQLFFNVKNKTIDPEVPTWSGGYTMGIQMLISDSDFNRALQVYLLMIDDGFELRDRVTVSSLIGFLEQPSIPDPLSPETSRSSLTPEQHEATLHRLMLLLPTLDESRPEAKYAPGQNAKRRFAKAKRLSEKSFVTELDRSMTQALRHKRSQQL